MRGTAINSRHPLPRRLVNHHVAAADYVIGIGGVDPQNSTGFGGGAKLALGVLGRRSIINLHYGNSSEQGSYNIDNDFRRELEEIADMLRLETSVCLHVDAHRRPYASPREITARFTVMRSPSPKDPTASIHLKMPTWWWRTPIPWICR